MFVMSECGWSELVAKCKGIHEKYGMGIKIPSVCTADPLEVFDYVDVSKNVFRFVVYILWLEKQPDAFDKHLYVRECREELWKDSLCKLHRVK